MKKSLGANTYLPTTPVLLVGTYDEHGTSNLMTAAWGGICCSKPPCLNISLRKATYSYDAIVRRQAFTVGVPSEAQVREADYVGMASGRKVNKFVETGFTAVKSDLVDAPYAAEIPFVLECKLIHSIELGLHTLFVGEIMDVKADAAILGADGMPNLDRFQPFVFDSMRQNYHGLAPVLAQAFSIGKK